MKRLVTLLAFCVFASSVLAQAPPTGVPPFSSVQSIGMDTINRQNLNVNFSIPIAASPGRGFNFSFPIVNDSLLWMKSSGTWAPVVDAAGNPTWGWKDTLPAGSTSFVHVTASCDTPPPIPTSPHYFGYAYTDPAGTTHKFNVDFYLIATVCGFPTGPRTGLATDQSGYVLDATSPTAPIVRAPDGKVITGTNWTDSNGNFISATVVSGSETDWKDSAGHTPLKIITSSTSIQYQYPDNAGVYQTSTLKLTSTPIKTNFACGVIEYTGTANLPTELDLPNSQKYFFTYEATPGNPTFSTGRIKRVTLPTGGYVEHTYGSTNDGINCTDASVNNLTVAVSDGTTTSTWQLTRAPSGSNWVTTVTAPLLAYDTVANQSTFTFNSSAQEISEKFYQGTATGTPLRTVNSTWTAGAPATQITILDDNSTQNEVETTFDTYGNLTLLKEHDFGTGAPGAPLRSTSYTYLSTTPYITANVLNRPTRVTVSDGSGVIKSRTDIAYDEATYVNSVCINGAVQHNDTAYGCSYTTRGNATTVTTYLDPVAPATPIAKHSYYDSLGNLVKADLNCCQQKTWTYALATNYAFPDSVTSGTTTPQLTVSYKYNQYTGLITRYTDENLQNTDFSYSDPGHLNRLTSVTPPNSAQAIYTYDDVGFSTQVDNPVQGTNVNRQKIFYDGLGRTKTEKLLDNSSTPYSATDTLYDALGRAYKTSNPYVSSPSYWSEDAFDALGRAIKATNPDGSFSTLVYSANSVTTTDPAGKKRKATSDGLGRMSSVTEPDPTAADALTLQTTYSYTLLDQLTQINQGSQNRTYLYDALGRLNSFTTPEAGKVCLGTMSGATCNANGYDSFNNLLVRTDARGVVTNYLYDTLNRLVGIAYPTVPGGITPMPNVCAATGSTINANVCFVFGTSPASLNNGRISSIKDQTGSESYSYDASGNVLQSSKLIGTKTYSTNYAYNLANQLIQLTYPSGRVVLQNLDPVGRLCSVGAPGSTCTAGTTYASGFAYNTAQQVTGFKYGNNIFASFDYSGRTLLLGCLDYSTTNRTSCAHDATTKFGLTYSYPSTPGNNGQISGITDAVDNGRSATYTFDSLYRLTTAVTTGSTGFPKWGVSEVYDRYGNRTDQNQTFGSPPMNHVTVSTSSNRITTSGYSYDASGNLTNDGNSTLIYDAENRPTSSTNGGGSGTYSFDANSHRIQKVSGGTTTVYIYSGSQVIAEYDNGAAVASPSREYIYGGEQRVATIQSGTTTYQHSDRFSVRMLTDSAGNVVGQRGAFPFGESWYETGTLTKVKFTTYERDSESGNDYAMDRTYVNRLGRFSSVDPLPGNLSDPQSLDGYSYALDDPINLADPTGDDPSCGTLPAARCFLCGVFNFFGGLFGGGAGVAGAPPGGGTTDDGIGGILVSSGGGSGSAGGYGGSGGGGGQGGGSGGIGSSTTTGVQPITNANLKAGLRRILKIPDCAAILGGANAAKQILSHFIGQVNVDTQHSTGVEFDLAKADLDAVPPGALLVTFVPHLVGNFSGGVFVGAAFRTYTGNNAVAYGLDAMLTMQMHEFTHVKAPAFANRIGLPDLKLPNVPGKSQNRTANVYKISKECGTALPPGF